MSPSTLDRPWGRRDAWACAALALLGLSYAALVHDAFWRGDDPTLLRHALDSAGLRAFHDAAHWQALSPSNLTPWVTQSLRIDALLAGPDPRFFHFRQVLSLVAVLLAGLALARPWLGPWGAAAAMAVFAAGAPTASVVQQVMTRHYLEGLLFALLAMLAHRQALCAVTRSGRTGAALLAGALYALACTAKEVYVPLVLVALVWPAPATPAVRAMACAPWLGVAAVYVLWRQAMLPSMVGGYGSLAALASVDGAAAALRALASVPRLLLGDWAPAGAWVAGGLALAWAAGLVAALRVRWATRLPALALGTTVVLAVVGPLLPLVRYPGLTAPDRYLFMPWFVLVMAGAWAVARAGGRVWGRAMPLLALATAALGVLQTVDVQRRTLGPWLGAFDVQGRQLQQAPSTHTLVPGRALLQTYWYVNDLCGLRATTGGGECPQVLVPGLPPGRPVTTLSVFDDASGAWRDASEPPALREATLARITAADTSRPLQVEMSLEAGWIRWRFDAGPPAVPIAWFVASPEIGRFPVPAEGALRMVRPELTVQVQGESTGGLRTVSPMLTVRPGEPVRWAR